ncbi:hypothetical protein CsSME_00015764 [Camellia sinensis var. sinensis]
MHTYMGYVSVFVLIIQNLLFFQWQIKQRRSSLKTVKKPAPSTPSSLQSKAKQVISDGCRKYGSCRKKRTRIEDLYNNDEAKFSVMERAEEVLANVADGFPSFVKCMLPSNVTHGFWLVSPNYFLFYLFIFFFVFLLFSALKIDVIWSVRQSILLTSFTADSS